jgi:hypothetical protein
LVTSSSPHSCRARPPVAAATMTLLWRERQRRGRPRHIAPIHRHAGHVAAPRRLRRRIFVAGDATLPRLPPLDAVVIMIALGDLALFVLRLARGAPPLRGRFVPVEDRLLRERRLDRNEVRTPQPQQQEGIGISRSIRSPRRSTSQQRTQTTEMYREGGDSQISQSPRGGASGAAALAATSRSTSRSPAPCCAGPQAVTGGSARSRSPSRGPGRPSSRRDEAAASGAAQLLGHGTALGLPTR